MLLGIDVGTTGTKSVLTQEDGKIIYSSYQSYELIRPKPFHVEQSPEDWWRAVVHTVRECVSHAGSPKDVTALCLSVQCGTLVPVDRNCRPTANAVSWLDTRGQEEHQRLAREMGEAYFYKKTGWKISNCFNFIQICHMRQNRPELFEKTAWFLSVADYLSFRLTGELVIDENSAGNSQLSNVSTGQWDEDILALAGIDKSRVSKMIKSGEVIGTLTPEAAEELNLPVSVQVVSGAQDQYCSAVSIDAIHPGDMMFSTGTSWVLLGVSNRQIYDLDTYLTIGRHILPDLYTSFAYTPAGGAGMKWYRDNMGAPSPEGGLESYDHITGRADKIAPGADGLFFFPHLGGTLFPTWSPESRGVLWGLDFMHTKDHIARAVLEGIAYELLWMIRSMEQKGYEFQIMKCLGGSTRSQVWMQMVSDMTGLEMSVSDRADMAPLGAAMIAGTGSGIYKNYQEAYEVFRIPGRHFYPDPARRKRYAASFEQYCELFQALRKTFRN